MSEQGTPTAIIHLGDTKHIEPGKTYSVEVEQLVPLDDEAVKNIIQTFEQSTGAKAVVVQGAKVARVTEAELAVARVRELHVIDEYGCCKHCSEEMCWGCQEWADCRKCECQCHGKYPCPTIQALDGDNV